MELKQLTNNSFTVSATDAFSFVDEMRKTARHAENLKNFIYEPTSGLYYDPKTSYYYNAVSVLQQPLTASQSL